MVLVKNIRKTDMPPKWSLIILQMYYFCCSLFFFFLVYFMLCSGCKEIENILSTFSKKDLNTNRRNIAPWKWKLCVNIYGTEFIQWIYWVRPIEGCFFWYLRVNKTGENFNLNVQINSNTVYRCQFFKICIQSTTDVTLKKSTISVHYLLHIPEDNKMKDKHERHRYLTNNYF